MLSFRHCVPTIAALLAANLLGFATMADAGWDVTFTRNERAIHSSSNYNLTVVLQQQNGGQIRQCTMNWNDADDECTITDFPSTTNALVSVYHKNGQYAGQRNVIGKISFWISIFSDMTVHIPTGVVRFTTDKTFSELVGLGNINLAILPQANIEMGEALSDRPNSGLKTYFGETFSNCAGAQLGSDKDGCLVSFLAGCYSPVFARPRSSDSKAKIWVNRGDALGADHVLCVEDGETVDYLIKVQ